MKFVSRSYERRHNPDAHGQYRHLHSAIHSAISGAPQEDRQNGVLSQVRAFANNELDLSDRFHGNIRLQPAQEWQDNSRRLFGRHQVGRTDKNEAQPDQDRQPIF